MRELWIGVKQKAINIKRKTIEMKRKTKDIKRGRFGSKKRVYNHPII